MPEQSDLVKVADFLPPGTHQRTFTLDRTTASITEQTHSLETDTSVCAAGWGSWIQVISPRQRPPFGAVFVHARKLWFWVGGTEIELTDDVTIRLENTSPLQTFRIMRGDEELLKLAYSPDLSESDDFLLYMAKRLQSASRRKAFAYLWAASAVGRERADTKFGLNDETVARIADPFDVEVDVLDE